MNKTTELTLPADVIDLLSMHANNLITQWAYADNEATLFNANFAWL